jgi:hypothetical protein
MRTLQIVVSSELYAQLDRAADRRHIAGAADELPAETLARNIILGALTGWRDDVHLADIEAGDVELDAVLACQPSAAR